MAKGWGEISWKDNTFLAIFCFYDTRYRQGLWEAWWKHGVGGSVPSPRENKTIYSGDLEDFRQLDLCTAIDMLIQKAPSLENSYPAILMHPDTLEALEDQMIRRISRLTTSDGYRGIKIIKGKTEAEQRASYEEFRHATVS